MVPLAAVNPTLACEYAAHDGAASRRNMYKKEGSELVVERE